MTIVFNEFDQLPDAISDLAKKNEIHEDRVKLAKRLGHLMYSEVSALTHHLSQIILFES